MTVNNCLTDFLLTAFKKPNPTAIAVVDILAASGSIEDKVKKLQDYEMQNIVPAIVAIGLATVHIEITHGVSELVKNKQSKLEELHNLKSTELAELILSLSTVLHTQSSKVRPFSMLLLLIPMLLSTRLFTLDSISEFLVNVINSNNISVVDIIECSNDISTAFSVCAEGVIPEEYRTIN